MNNYSIRIEGLSKKYKIGGPVLRYKTFRDSLNSKLGSFKKIISHRKSELKKPNEIWALKNINLEIERGEVLGIIGANGAGKSTLLKIISRITEPSSGRIIIDGRVGALLEVGTGFHPELTGRENIFLNGAILGMTKTEMENKFDEIVDFAEIGEFLDTPVKRYSSGMGVRLAFAVAAHLEPEILVVDEVLAVGDLAFKKKCLGKMEDVGKEGRTVLFVSHDMNSIRRLCKKALLLDKGKILFQGDVHEVINKYEETAVNDEVIDSSVAVRKNPPHSEKYFSKVSLYNGRAIPVNNIKYGDKIILEIEMDGRSPYNSHFVEWFLNEKDHGNRVAWGATHALPDGDIESSIKKIKFEIGPLNLAEGKYAFSLAMGVPGVINLDYWTDAILFEITNSYLDKSGYRYSTRYAPSLINYTIIK